MRAIHINWTLPFTYMNNKEYFIEDFEILSTILSALKWTKYNGSIKLYTDTTGYSYYKNLGILDIWDDGINVDILNNEDYKIDPVIFWAAGKIIILKEERVPLCIIDTDLIVWKDISSFIHKRELVSIHKEELINEIYPNKDNLKIPNGYSFDEDWDWAVPACNCAFVYFSNETFKQYYTKESLRFMINNFDKPDGNVIQMVFAEQRLLGMCAKKMGVNVDFIFKNPFEETELITHIWGYKSLAKNNKEKRTELCTKLIRKILQDFPERYDMLQNISTINNYFKHL